MGADRVARRDRKRGEGWAKEVESLMDENWVAFSWVCSVNLAGALVHPHQPVAILIGSLVGEKCVVFFFPAVTHLSSCLFLAEWWWIW